MTLEALQKLGTAFIRYSYKGHDARKPFRKLPFILLHPLGTVRHLNYLRAISNTHLSAALWPLPNLLYNDILKFQVSHS